MKIVAAALVASAVLLSAALGADPAAARVLAQAPSADKAPTAYKATKGDKVTGGSAREVVARGTVTAVDKEKQTVTVKGPKRTVTIEVRDPAKLEAIKVGDPVIAKYYESVAFEVKAPGTATPGASAQEAVASSKPGETPAGAVGRQITVTATVTAIDKKAQTVTIKGPEGNSETIKARDPKNLDKVKVGDLVEITYTQALALSLDKEAKAAKQGKAHQPAKQ